MKPPAKGARVIGRVCGRSRRGRFSEAIYACHVCDKEGRSEPATVICDACDLPACAAHVGEHAKRSEAHPDGFDRCSTCAGGVLPLGGP